MPTGYDAKPIGTLSLAGSFVPSGEKKRRLDDVFAGRNIRSTLDGGRHDRPGYEDTQIDLSSYNFTAARGFFAGRFLKRLWLAGDNGTNVKVLYANPSDKTVYDTGLALATGKKVWFCEVEMDIFYGNGSDAMGRIVVGELKNAASAGATSVTLKSGQGARFPTGAGPYTVRHGSSSFTYTTRSGDVLSGIPASGAGSIGAAIAADTVFTYTTTITPTHVTAPTVLAQWYATLNIAGEPGKPRVWEFSRTGTAANPERFYDFSVSTNNELVGEGSQITGFFKSNNYFYVFKEDSIWFVSRADILNSSSGARSPAEFSPTIGLPNPWCVAEMDGIVAFLSSNKRLLPIVIKTENASQQLKLDGSFDARVRNYLRTIDDDLTDAWVFYNHEDQLLKVGVLVDGVREILVYDAALGIFYPPDTNKDFAFMAAMNGKSYAYSSDGQKVYLDEVGRYDDTTPVDGEWETGRFGGENVRSAFRELYAHGSMVQGSRKKFTIYINGEEKYTKELDDSFIKTGSIGKSIGHAGIGTAGIGVGSQSLKAKEFQMPIGLFEHGQDIKIKVHGRSADGGDFVQVDGFAFAATPRAKNPTKHV